MLEGEDAFEHTSEHPKIFMEGEDFCNFTH